MALLEARPYRPFKSSEEYLEAMKEDLAEWLNILYPELLINTENFLDCLDTGVALCKHANNVRQAAEDYLARRHARNRSMTRSMTSGLTGPILAMGNVHYLPAAKSGTFFARDNVSNFITWCRKSLRIIECLLFETDDLIMRKNEKHVILCLLEVARRGAKFGMLAPMLVQMEREIDREIAADIKASGIFSITRSGGVDTLEVCIAGRTGSSTIDEVDYSDSSSDSESEDCHTDGRMLVYGPQPQIVTNDLKSLDEMVRDLVEKCICQSQFPMVRVSEGKYRIGDTKVLIFVRILRSHVMVRVGGGWDTLSHYLDKHDPCRCKAQHRPSLSARVVPRSSNQTNGIELHKAQVIFERSPPTTRKTIANFNNQSTNIHNQNQTPSGSPSTTNNYGFSLAPKLRSRSPTPQRKFLNQLNLNNAGDHCTAANGGDKFVPNVGKNKLTSPSITRRSISPGPKRFLDMRKKQNSLDSFTNSKKLIANIGDAGNLNEQIEGLSLTHQDGGGKEPLKNAGDNASDNGSEISDEGYRSLGILQANARGRVAPTFPQQSYLPVPFAPTSNALSPEEDRTTLLKNKYEDNADDGPQSLPALLPSNSGLRNPPENQFEHFGVFVTDDNITVDVERTSCHPETDFSTVDKLPKISAVNHGSKLPSSALGQQRRRSVDNSMYSGSLQDLSGRSGLPVLNRKTPQYRSMRKSFEPSLAKDTVAGAVRQLPNKAAPRNVNNTWSGQSTANGRKRPTIKADTFSPNDKPRTVAGTKTCTLYDSNGRRVKGCTSSLNTSPVKNNSASPLAQQLLEAANSAKNDAQILAKMKTLLSQYSSSNQKAYSSKVNNKDSLYEDFTSAWVHNNGNFERRNSCSPPTKTLSKRSSAASSAESTHSRDLSVIVAPRRDRGTSKIPAPLQQKSELY